MMSDIFKDVGKIWDRLFDHRGFLIGEISFVLREFEQNRGDTEVDNLFTTVENTADIKDSQISRLREVVSEKVSTANTELSRALDLCCQFSQLEEKYKQSTAVDEERFKRKIIWESFMDDITSEYHQINSDFEEKKELLKQGYQSLEKSPLQ